jgi:acyl carrier protein
MRPELLVSRVLGVPAREVRDETSSAELGAWDSLAHVTLVMEMETAYGVVFSVEEALRMTSVGAIKQVLAGRGVRW